MRNFRAPVEDKRRIPQMVFGGFKRCLYLLQKFHSDSERQFAVVLENEKTVEKWVKPARANFQIQLDGGKLHEPDLVVEAAHGMYLCEVKADREVEEAAVLAKADAAAVWCRHATEMASQDGKPWRYLLVPAEAIQENASLEWMAKQYEHTSTASAEVVEPGETAVVLPFKKLEERKIKPFENCVPVYRDLKIAARRFGEAQGVDGVPQQAELDDPEAFEWVAFRGHTRPGLGLFVAQVGRRVDEQAHPERRVVPVAPEPGCEGDGTKVVLARHNQIHDQDLGEYTVKLYERRQLDEDGDQVAITLRPHSHEPEFEPIELTNLAEGGLRIVAPLVEVLH